MEKAPAERKPKLPPSVRSGLKRTFDAGKARLRLELVKNLSEIDVLKRDKLDNVVAVFDERLHLFQHDFLGVVAQSTGDVAKGAKRHKLGGKSGASHLPTVLGAAAGAVGGGAAGGLTVATATTGFWFWATTTTTSLATAVAGVTGLSLDMVTGGLSLGGGIVGAVAVNKAMSGRSRRKIREKLLADFDERIVPALDEWAKRLLK